MCKLLITYGCRSWAYWMAFSNGNPFEWNDIKQSHRGHFSTGSFRMISSLNTIMRMYSNSCSRVRISFIGFDWDFLAMAQTATTTCLYVVDESSESRPSVDSRSPWRGETR